MGEVILISQDSKVIEIVQVNGVHNSGHRLVTAVKDIEHGFHGYRVIVW
jgi:hypothetical protein